MAYTADQLATIIKMACKKDVIDLGEASDQDFYIFEWINMYMFQNAKKIRKTATSDPLVVSSTGYVTFLTNSQPITDMYEPILMLDPTDKAVTPRSSFDNGNGWYHEDAYTPIHIRGLNGTYRIKYIKYPDKITLGTQTPECTPAGYAELISWVCAKIKLTKNFYAESQALMSDANSVRYAASRAAQSALGTNQQKPGDNDANLG